MPTSWAYRRTALHPALWAPYRLTAYPDGFTGARGYPDLPPVWEADAMVIGRGHRGQLAYCFRPLGDSATIDEALERCWEHYASLH